ncbi:siderophore-interacting protein [Gulosibacter faecalis]|jgi:NADPH-dependent ferric siderophore reductase|uniref:siderophore-interacting protein n=1 Tax=Gulosibacter faecalis TaxID=272240 RepID=UPI0005924FEE|nr:SIP domain-containing protein [Gulosibacter faecalis]
MSREEVAGLLAVLQHPDHKTGIEDRYLTVTGIERRAAGLVRVSATVSGDDDLAHWDLPNPTVRISMPEPPEEFASIPGAPQSTSRVYTLADVDIARRTVEIDLVRHGEGSPAMRWLAALAVGDRIDVVGPREHRIPGPGSPRVLLADSSALPAAARILATTPLAEATTIIAAVPADEFALLEAQLAGLQGEVTAERVDPDGQLPLATAFAALDLPATASVWAAGEREDIREIRRRCKHDLGLPPAQTQVFGYWKRGMTNTRLDLARLRASQRVLATGGDLTDQDDFEIEL